MYAIFRTYTCWLQRPTSDSTMWRQLTRLLSQSLWQRERTILRFHCACLRDVTSAALPAVTLTLSGMSLLSGRTKKERSEERYS